MLTLALLTTLPTLMAAEWANEPEPAVRSVANPGAFQGAGGRIPNLHRAVGTELQKITERLDRRRVGLDQPVEEDVLQHRVREAAAEHWTVMFEHDSVNAFGRVVADGHGRTSKTRLVSQEKYSLC